MEHDVTPGWDAAKRSARNSQLQWVKDDQASLSSLAPLGEGSAAAAGSARSRSSGLSRLSRWTRKHLAPKSIRSAMNATAIVGVAERAGAFASIISQCCLVAALLFNSLAFIAPAVRISLL